MDYIRILRNREYDSLQINRIDGICYLVIEYEGVKHVYADEKGKRKEYRHAWQIKQWLIERMELPDDLDVPVLSNG